MNTLFTIKLKILFLLERIYSSRSPNYVSVLPIEPTLISNFLAPTPISFKQMMALWCPSLDPHLSTHHSDIGV